MIRRARHAFAPLTTLLVSWVLSAALVGCTTDNPSYCDEDKPCTDPEEPYCDVLGDYGAANTCVPTPALDAGEPADASVGLDGAPAFTLSVAVDGSGTVTSDPAGIDCGSTCAHDFPVGTGVGLAAIPTPGNRFLSWSGDCSGSTPACELTADAPKTATAHFGPIKVTQIAVGWRHACALLNNGAIRCWGNGANGRLGYGNTDNIGDDETPAEVGDVDVGGIAKQIAAGSQHTCALLDTGSVRCWGDGTFGQLGYASTDTIGDNEFPSTAGDVDVGGKVTQISAGFLHTCALLETGAVRCWGSGASGQLGYANTDTVGDTESPASAGNVDVGGTVVQISAGGAHTCALLDTGVVRCWGNNNAGQLGYGNTNTIGDNETPASAGDVVVGRSAARITTGYGHTCARLDTTAVRCWGGSPDGQLGYGNTNSVGDDELPESAGDVPIGRGAPEVAAGFAHTCARLDTNEVRCWGNGNNGRLGYGNTATIGDDEPPSSAGSVDVGDDVETVSAGEVHTCALLLRGAVRCWGGGGLGRLGYGNTDTIGDDEVPASAGDVPIF